MDLKRTPFQRRFDDLKGIYEIYKPVHKDISDLIYPGKGFFEGDTPNQNVKINYKKLLDGHPALAANTFASGMQSGMTSKATQWMEVTTFDPELAKWRPAKEWFEYIRDFFLGVFESCNLYRSLFDVYTETGVFATGCLSLHEDYKNVIRPNNYTIGEYYVSSNDYGKIDTIALYLQMRVCDVVNTFGKENCSRTLLNLWNDNRLYDYVKIAFLCEPNDGRDPVKKDNQNMPFRAVYWEQNSDEDKLLRFSGYEEFPYMVPRLGVRTNSESYGRSAPGWLALGDSKTLQEFRKNELAGIARAADPPLQLFGNINGGIINSLPGGMNVVTGTERAGISQLYDNNFLNGVDRLRNAIVDQRQHIERLFFNDFFRMLQTMDTRQRTAREVAELHEEKLMMLSPILDSMEEDLLDPIMERTFAIAMRKGLIPPPPKELEGAELKIEYTSILAQAQKLSRTVQTEQFASFVGGLAAVNPGVLDKVDWDSMVDDYGDKVGVPSGYLLPNEVVAKNRAAKEQAIQRQMQIEQAGQLAQGAKTLSETDTGSNNALTQLLGGGT